MVKSWFSIWYEPEENETVAFLSMERIAEIGGCQEGANWTPHQVNQGNAILAKWCRQNCKSPGQPVNVRGKTGWAFQYAEEALLFKLTWG